MDCNFSRVCRGIAIGIGAMIVLGSTIALADSSGQKNKNLWRNVTIGSGALAINGLVHHNNTETLLGAAGAAYSANRYETDRHHQSQRQQARRNWAANHSSRMHYRSSAHRYYSYNGHRYEYIRSSGRRIELS